MILLAAGGAAGAAGLAFAAVRSRAAASPPVLSGAATAVLVVLASASLVAALPMSTLALVAAGGLTALAIGRLVRRRQALVRARHRAGQVLLACESIAGDLGVGLAPQAALDRVATQWAEFAPVAAAGRLDADVAAELRRLANLPGAGELAGLGAAWQVSHRSGAGLASTLSAITSVVRADAATARLVETELAAARATAALLVALPAAVLLLGQGIGARPWHFLTGSVVGIGCLAVGATLDLAGVWWLQRIASGVLRA